jgi:hypothetical protein
VAGKVPKAMEELRTKTEYQLADDPFSLPQITAQEIVNRLSGAIAFQESL